MKTVKKYFSQDPKFIFINTFFFLFVPQKWENLGGGYFLLFWEIEVNQFHARESLPTSQISKPRNPPQKKKT